MPRYKATIIINIPDQDSHSRIFQYIAKVHDCLGLFFDDAVRARRWFHYTPLEDIQDDIQTRLIEESGYKLKERTATYELASWERLPA
jgi:hypothetical protein